MVVASLVPLKCRPAPEMPQAMYRYDGTAVSKRIWGAGSDVLSYAIAVEELSRVDGDHYVLNGGKIFITNADKAYVGMS